MPSVELTAGRIHYVQQGSGPAVVLLHGLLMNHTVWDSVMDRLPDGFRYIRPDLPLGAHPEPMRPDADLSMRGLCELLAEFLSVLNLTEVTLVVSDWGGPLFLTAYGLDNRVGQLVILPCEAFDNFPPGLPGRVAATVARVPGAIAPTLRLLRIPWLRRTPLMFGHMARREIPQPLMVGWTERALRDAAIRRDLRRYVTSPFTASEFLANTEALQAFTGPALVLWSSAGKTMPRSHGPRLAGLLPNARLVEIDDAYVLSMLDQPETVATALTEFLTA